jgi:Ca-activated chloride channel family protein
MAFKLLQDRKLAPAGQKSERHVIVRVQAPASKRKSTRPNVHIAFVIDRSGSMALRPLDLAKDAVLHALRRLEPRDRFTVIAYDHEVEIITPAQNATPKALRRTARALAQLEARGSTNLSSGWKAGLEQLKGGGDPDAVRRCLLLTDGYANDGITSHEGLRELARRWRLEGMSTSCFGMGAGFDETLLGPLADDGGGTFRFIRAQDAIVKAFDDEMGEALDVVARNVEMDILIYDGVRAKPMGPYQTGMRPTGSPTIYLPDLVSRQELDVAVRIKLPGGAEAETAKIKVQMRDQKGELDVGRKELEWTYVDPRAAKREKAKPEVIEIVAAHVIDAARESAIKHNERGNYRSAMSILSNAARKLDSIARGNPKVRDWAEDLRADASAYAVPMDAEDRKERYSVAYSRMRGKAMDGTSLRRDES